MIESVAVLSDVHGVLPALDAVLAVPEVANADRVVVTGDHAAGPQPVAVLDRLVSLGKRVVLVRGNADRELLSLVDGTDVDVPDPVSRWAAEQVAGRPRATAASAPALGHAGPPRLRPGALLPRKPAQ